MKAVVEEELRYDAYASTNYRLKNTCLDAVLFSAWVTFMKFLEKMLVL